MSETAPQFAGCMPDDVCMVEAMNDIELEHLRNALNRIDGEDISASELRDSCRLDKSCIGSLVSRMIDVASPALIEQIKIVRGEASTQRALATLEKWRTLESSTDEDAIVLEFPVRSSYHD